MYVMPWVNPALALIFRDHCWMLYFSRVCTMCQISRSFSHHNFTRGVNFQFYLPLTCYNRSSYMQQKKYVFIFQSMYVKAIYTTLLKLERKYYTKCLKKSEESIWMSFSMYFTFSCPQTITEITLCLFFLFP